MHIDTSTTVGDLAAGIPGATRIFEARRIDYCCAGARSLAEACADAGVRADELMAELERAAGAAESEDPIQWEQERLADLAKHIVERHHAYTRRELERLDGLLRRVLAAHLREHPELETVGELFKAMQEDSCRTSPARRSSCFRTSRSSRSRDARGAPDRRPPSEPSTIRSAP